MHFCLGTAILALATWGVSAIDPPRQPRQPLGNGTLLLTYNETVTSPRFSASSQSVSWLAGGDDGQYIYQDSSGALVLENFVTGDSTTYVSADKIPSDLHEYWIRPDLQKVLFATNYTKQYRYTYFADYSILDVASGEVTPLVEDQTGDIQYAEFAPVGDVIAFVRGNNLYLTENGNITQITADGGPDLFHAVPDWVYEEEIFGLTKAFWFSPDAAVIAFLSFNETGVGTFTVEYYMDNQEIAPSYPRELDLRYPKVGTTNPSVDLTMLFVETGDLQPVAIDAFDAEDLIIGEVTWMTNNSVVYRAFNRVQDHSKHVRVDVAENASSSTIIRDRDGSDGWLDNMMSMQYIGPVNGSGKWYLDLSDESGWQHLYLYSVDGKESVALTSGEWEVTAVLKVDASRNLIYYLSTEHSSIERHLYSVSYTSMEKKALVDDTVSAYWSASFSSDGGYYILSYQGPDVPYQELYSINSTTEPIRTITSNEALWNRIQDHNLPNITYLTLERPDGFSLNIMQRLPPNFDPSKKYPVLFTPYGGPTAQEVSMRFQSLTWKAYITSDPELQFITYTVDGRGTGYKGRAFRSTVASHLGKYEAEDQIWAAQQLISQYPYIDESKFGIFGWSFGGYLSAKVLEADSGVFSFGLIVAPVSDWRFYDSMYTERYMKTYEMNPEGYNETAVRKTDGFKNVPGGFSIMHGLGDDNVHYQNTAALIDILVGDGVSPEKMDWRAFTDSDHGISYNGASTYLYKYLTEMLYKEVQRDAKLSHQWSRRGEAAHLPR